VSFLMDSTSVIEECDSLDMKFLVREAARDRQIPVIMETSDRGVLDVERFDLERIVRSSTDCWRHGLVKVGQSDDGRKRVRT